MNKIRIFTLLSAVLAFSNTFAQTTKDGIYEFERENYQSAASILTKLVKAEPTKPENYYYLGLSLMAAGKDDSAGTVFNAAIAADARYTLNYAGLGQYYLNKNKTADALAAFEKAKEYATRKDTRVLCAIASAYTHSTNPNFAEALNVLSKADEINGKSLENYLTKGDVYFAKNEGGPAITNYTYAVEGKFQAAHCNTYIGVIWKQALKYDSAYNSFQAAIKDDPNFAPAYRELAECYYKQNKLELAKNTFQKYLQLADKNDLTLNRYAEFLILSKDYANAIKVSTDLLNRSHNPYLYRYLAISYFETGDSVNALKYSQLTLNNMDPKKVILLDYDYAAKTWQKMGNDSMMVLSYNKEIGMDSSKGSEIYGNLAKYYYDKKNFPKAAECYLNKVKLSKTADATDYYRAGLAYFRSKMYIKADSAFTNAARTSPTWVIPNTYIGRSRNAQDTGAFTGIAIEAYKKVIALAGADSIKNKKDLAEAWNYVAYYQCFVKHDSKEATAALKHVLNIDPENKEALELSKTLNCVEQKPVPANTQPKKGEKAPVKNAPR